jgi:uncharacterized protein
MSADRPIAIVTGASTGIGCELARRCANEGYDLLIAADEPAIEQAAASLRSAGQSGTLQADLATIDGVDELYSAAKGRPVDALLANAGRGRLQSILTGLFAVSGANNNWTWSQDLMRRSAVYKHGLA